MKSRRTFLQFLAAAATSMFLPKAKAAETRCYVKGGVMYNKPDCITEYTCTELSGAPVAPIQHWIGYVAPDARGYGHYNPNGTFTLVLKT